MFDQKDCDNCMYYEFDEAMEAYISQDLSKVHQKVLV